MDRGKERQSRLEDRIVTMSARSRNRKRPVPTTSAFDPEATSSPEPHHDAYVRHHSQSSRSMEDEDQNEAVLPTPQPSRTTTTSMSSYDSSMGSASMMPSGSPMHHFVDTEEATDDAGYAGGPMINNLIPSYPYHVAHQLWTGQDRGLLTVHARHNTLKTWHITEGQVTALIEQSGIGHLPDIMYDYIDEPLLSAFVERWQPDTNTFHMPYGEMSISLHDTAFLLGVPVAGEPITPPCDSNSSEVLRILGNTLGYTGYNEELKLVTGWSSDRAKQSMMRALVDRAGVRASKKARVYLWWMLTSTLFVDRRPENASKYAWGAGALAHLYRDLGMTSRSDCRALAGCATLFQAWIYAYFPCFRPQSRLSWAPNQPHARRWIPRSIRAEHGEESLREYRLMLDRLTADHVDWLPFVPDPASLLPISSFTGIIHCRSINEVYMPDRFARQFGRTQGIPHPPMAPRKAVRTTNARDYRVDHEQAVWAFQRGSQVNSFRHVPHAAVASHSEPDYQDWYTARTHPRLVPGDQVELPASYGMDPYQSMQQMAGTLSTYHRDVYDDSSAPQSDDLRGLADICEHMMPRFSINHEGPYGQ